MNTNRFYTTMLLLWIGHFIVDFMIGVWPIFKTLAHLDLALAGMLAGLCAFLGEGMQIIFGSLSDRGYRKGLILSGVLMASSGVLFAYTESYFLFFILLLMICMGSGAFHPSAVGLIGSLPSHRKAVLVTLFTTGGSLGMACSQLIFANTYEFFGGHTLILALPSLALVMFAIFYQWMGTDKIVSQTSKKIQFHLYFKYLKHPPVAFIFISLVCNQIFIWSFNFLLPDILNSREYDSWLSYGGGYFCFIIGGAFLMLPAGYLADKFSTHSVIIASSLIGTSLFYLFLFLPNLPDPLILALLFGVGASFLTTMPLCVALGNRLVPENPGVISALLMGIVWCISESFGPGMSGLLTKFFEEDAPTKALACMSLFAIAATIMAFKLPKTAPANRTQDKDIKDIKDIKDVKDIQDIRDI